MCEKLEDSCVGVRVRARVLVVMFAMCFPRRSLFSLSFGGRETLKGPIGRSHYITGS